MIYLIGAVILSYLIGAIPTGYICGKLLKGIDIRTLGSGNVGATNVFRVVGKIPGLVVFIIDFLKGLVAVTVIPFCVNRFFSHPEVFSHSYIYLLLGIAAISGHIWTIFLKFKGGKGVATTAGVITGLAPLVFVTCFGAWLVVFFIWRYVSLASITAAVLLPVTAGLTGQSIDFVIFCSVLALLGVYSHRSNIRRLLKGNENKS